MSALLTVENLRTGFDTREGFLRAVDGIDFQIAQGGTLGVVGESGCGKSVTALSVMRLIDRPGRIAGDSRIMFEGRDLAALEESELEKIRGNDISMIFQEPMTSLNPVFTVGDQIAEAVQLHQNLELMKELRERLGMAILLITHDLGVVAEMVDEVAVMYAGRIVERGRVSDIFESPQHPYTESLLDSIPLLGMRYSQPLKAIRGVVPSPLEWPPACRFAPRCDYAFSKCLAEDPPLLPVPPQESACWLCEDGRRVPRAGQTEALA